MKRRPSRLALALKEWRRFEKSCAESVRIGTAFLQDDAGQLLLFEGRPVLECSFAMAWEARRAVERLCVEEGADPPPLGVSSDYGEWPAVSAMTQLFLSWGSPWEEVSESVLEHYEETGRVESIGAAEIGWE